MVFAEDFEHMGVCMPGWVRARPGTEGNLVTDFRYEFPAQPVDSSLSPTERSAKGLRDIFLEQVLRQESQVFCFDAHMIKRTGNR